MSAERRHPAQTAFDVDTPHGAARVHLQAVAQPRAVLALGHGAGGGVSAPDLLLAAEAALAQDVNVALIEQPYRVAGRRSPAPARQLDAAWIAVTERLSASEQRGLPLIVGGRSSGARVACRTAATTGAAGVLCLAFPLSPPRRSASAARTDRLDELELVSVPMLIVQGTSDPFGMPPEAERRQVAQVAGTHSLRSDGAAIRDAVSSWLSELTRDLVPA